MEIISYLVNQLSEFYTPLGTQGVLQIELDDSDSRFFLLIKDTISYEKGVHESPDAWIKMSHHHLKSALASPFSFEPRSSDFTLGIRVGGYLPLIHRFTQLLKRPSLDLEKSIKILRDKKIPYSNVVKREEKRNIDVVQESIDKSQPMVISNAVNWEAMKWSSEEKKIHLGEKTLRYNPKSGVFETFNDLFESMEKNERSYTNGCRLPEDLKEFFPLGEWEKLPFHSMQIWLGKGQSGKPITRLHCDFATSLLFQIEGEKKLFLYSPDQYELVYAEKTFNMYQPSLIDMGNVDYSKFPLFEKSRPLEVTIRPGELLVIPKGWFHCVWANGKVFSLSCFYNDSLI